MGSPQVVEGVVMGTDSLDLESFVEPYFVFFRSNFLTCPEALSTDRYLSHIDYRILHNPLNLTDHVRKILLLQSESLDHQKLAAALADLFFVLKASGFALRRRLLMTSRELIDSHVFNNLDERLKSGLLSMSEHWLSELPTLMLEKPQLEIVRKQDQAKSPADGKENGMHLVDEYIENSQIDLAMDTLEEIVQKAPGDDEPAQLLIELYRQTAEYARFQSYYQKLDQTRHESLPDCWQMASVEFTQS